MNAPVQALETRIVRNNVIGDLRQFRLSKDIDGVGRAGELITLAVNPSDTSDQLRGAPLTCTMWRPMRYATTTAPSAV